MAWPRVNLRDHKLVLTFFIIIVMMSLVSIVRSSLTWWWKAVCLTVVVLFHLVSKILLVVALHNTGGEPISKAHLLLMSCFLLARAEIVWNQSYIVDCSILEVLRYLLSISPSVVSSGTAASSDRTLWSFNRSAIVVAWRSNLRLICKVRLTGHALQKSINARGNLLLLSFPFRNIRLLIPQACLALRYVRKSIWVSRYHICLIDSITSHSLPWIIGVKAWSNHGASVKSHWLWFL